MKKKNLIAIICIVALVVVLGVSLAACNKTKALYKPTEITYDYENGLVSWHKVELADYYTVSINGGEEKRSNGTSFSYDAAGQPFDVTVGAVVKKKTYTESRHFTPLATIETINISDGGEISWDAISGATAYLVSVNTNENVTADVRYQLPEGTNTVKVRPIVSGDDSYVSKWSGVKSARVFAKPSNIKYDDENGILTWSGNGANEFLLNINGNEFKSSSREWIFKSDNKDFTVDIKAIGDHSATFDSAVASETFHYLDPVVDFVVADGVLTWTGVDGAQGYDVRVGGVQTTSVTDAKFDKIAAGRDYEISVKPYNKSGNYFSSWSAIQSVYVLEAPVLKWDSNLTADGQENNNISWGLSQKASSYRVKVKFNGEELATYEVVNMAYGYAYEQVGKYEISVQAVAGESSNAYDSKYSTPITVERLASPNIANVKSTADDISKGFTVSYSSVSGAKGYKIFCEQIGEIEGKATSANSITVTDIIKDDVTEEQHFTYYVRSVGGRDTLNGQTYVKLDSLTATTATFEITVLAMPALMTMEEGRFTGRLYAQGEDAVWNAVPNAAGYSLKYDNVTKNADQATCSLAFLSAGNHAVSVCAKGNGQKVLASNYTPSINVRKLEAPSNMRIVGNHLECTYPQETGVSFKAYVGVGKEELDQASVNNIREKIYTTGTDISVRTIGDLWTDSYATYILSSDYSQNHRFYKYETPTFPADGPVSTRTQFMWNAPGNISGTTPTYTIESNTESIVVSGLNGTAYSLTDLDAGTYQWRLKANGDGTTYIDSEYTIDQSFIKLATPTVTVDKQNGLYVWDAIPNANGYSIRFGDRLGLSKTEQNDRSQHTYNPAQDLTSIGSIEVKLVATGTGLSGGAGALPAVDSKPFVMQQIVKKINNIEFEYSYSQEEVGANGEIEVHITKPSAVTDRYEYYIQGALVSGQNGETCRVVKSTPGKYNIKVKALGACFDNEGSFYLDSDLIGDDSNYIILLEKPSQNDIKQRTQGNTWWFTWSTIPNAIQYEYAIAFDDEDINSAPTVKVNTADMGQANHRDITGHKTVTVKLRALGNGDYIVSSEWTVKTFTL